MKIVNNKDLLKKHISTLNLGSIFTENLYDILSLHIFGENETILKEDDAVVNLYVLINGQTGVQPSSEVGKSSILDIIIPGDVIGDMEYFNSDNYYHKMIALTPCVLLAIPTKYIDKYFNNNIGFYKYITKNLAQKMKRTSYKFSRVLLYPLKNRLSKYLLDLSRIYGENIPDIQPSHTAEYFGVSTRHLRRVFAELEKNEILIRDNSVVKILDLKRLKSLATYK